jgi:hypothetical protein
VPGLVLRLVFCWRINGPHNFVPPVQRVFEHEARVLLAQPPPAKPAPAACICTSMRTHIWSYADTDTYRASFECEATSCCLLRLRAGTLPRV